MDIVKVEMRDTRAKAKQLRRAGIVPCCVYGGGLEEALSIQMDQNTADQLLRVKREGSKVRLELNGKQIPVQIKEKTRNFRSNQIEHIQFQALKADQKVNSVAHIFLKHADLVPGILEQMLFEVPFASLPADMIDTVTIDLEGMTAGTDVTVADIPEFCKEGVDLLTDRDSMVLRIREKKLAAAAEEGA